MPPRAPPKVFILLLKTHKLTVLVSFPNTSTVLDVKTEAFDALQSAVLDAPNPHAEFAMDEDPSEWEVPKVSSMDDFVLVKAAKERGRPTGRYEELDEKAQLKNALANWESVFIQFRDPNGGGLCPVKVSTPPMLVEEEEEPSAAARKGKRKAVE